MTKLQMLVKAITPETRVSLISLFTLCDTHTASQKTILRNIAGLLGTTVDGSDGADGECIEFHLYVENETAAERVDSMLKNFGLTVQQLPKSETFYLLAQLEQARRWLRNSYGGLTLGLSERIPEFNEWCSMLNPIRARNLYYESVALQRHKDEIIMTAIQTGLELQADDRHA